MTIRTIYHVNERCRITEDGPEVVREYRLGEDTVSNDSFVFLMGPYTQSEYNFPVLGQQYDEYTEIYVSDVQAQRSGSDREWNHNNNTMMLHVWKVTVTWKPDPVEKNEWPDAEGIYDVSVFGEEVDMDGRFDWAGNANVNTAGEFYEDKLPIKAPITVVRLTAKELSPPDMGLHKATNLDTFWGFGPSYWLCRNVSGEFVHGEHALYWKNTYEFAFNPNTWYLWKASSGYYHRASATGAESEFSGSRVRNCNQDGSENLRPCLLDANGQELPDGSDPCYQGFQIYHSYAFPNFPNLLSALDLTQWPVFPFLNT